MERLCACQHRRLVGTACHCHVLSHSVFDHQIMLKGFNFIGGIPEHVVKRAHLDVRACAGCRFAARSVIQRQLASACMHLRAPDVRMML